MVSALLGLLLLQANVVLLVILAGLAGLALFRKPSDFPAGQQKGRPGQMKGGGR
jgi:hypothetical protein